MMKRPLASEPLGSGRQGGVLPEKLLADREDRADARFEPAPARNEVRAAAEEWKKWRNEMRSERTI